MRRRVLAAAVLLATAMAAGGASPGGPPARADTLPGDPAGALTSYFNWVDHASPGMSNDNIHIVNPNGAAATGTITVPGLWSAPFSVGAFGTTFVMVPVGVIGGPATVRVTSGPGVVASQRIQYQQSFSEISAAAAGDVLKHGYFPWYDRASPGMTGDNIHLLNPGPDPSIGTLTLPGADPIPFQVPAAQERFYSFAAGTINGPLSFDVTSGPGVVASQRVLYAGSFNEVLALDPARARSTWFFNWFDHASAGVLTDNIHVVNPQPSATVTVTGSGPGLADQRLTLGPGQQGYLSWTGIGGPIRLDATGGAVLATQRLQWPPTFAEWPARAAEDARTDFWFPWYDNASPGFTDDIHVANPSTSAAAVTLSLPGRADVTLNVTAGSDAHYAFAAGTIGGPLHIHVSAGPGVLASQRAFIVPPSPSSRTLNVPLYHQDHPLSCEEASLRMALAYEGVNVSEDQIFSTMGIDYRAPVRDASGFHWGDPYAQFVGDPNGSEVNNTGYGSYNEAVTRTATSLGGGVLASGERIAPEYLYESILNGHPAVAWVSFDWAPHSPTFYTAFDGRWIRFGSPYEHAVTLIGVTPDAVLVNNPWQGQQWISKPQFEAAYGTFNNMAVVLR